MTLTPAHYGISAACYLIAGVALGFLMRGFLIGETHLLIADGHTAAFIVCAEDHAIIQNLKIKIPKGSALDFGPLALQCAEMSR